MKLVSWNVNGLRACLDKGFMDAFRTLDADIFCIQETKMQEGQAAVDLPGYHQYWNSAEKKGYSGTAVFSKEEPAVCAKGLGDPGLDAEGRILALEYERFVLVNVYTPNSQRELARLPLRMRWEDRFRVFLRGLDRKKPVVVCGDMNVAHQKIDIKNPGPNRGNAGFTDEERDKMTALLEAGFTDSFRKLYPLRADAYTWWSYMANARDRNIGWRLDYFLVSNRFMPEVEDSIIRADIMGSDHCPIMLVLKEDKMSAKVPPDKSKQKKEPPRKKKAAPKEQYVCSIDSPLGELTAASDGEHITGLWFVGQKYYAPGVHEGARRETLPVFRRLEAWLGEYFAGKKPAMDLPLKPEGSAFRQAVWNLLRAIPCGELTTYGEIAQKLGKDGKAASARAVGGAVGHNPISILIPCHRVVGANGSLTGYAGGVERKKKLLGLEGQRVDRE